MDEHCTFYSIYGFHARISGKSIQKTSGIFYGQSDFLYFSWIGLYEYDRIYRCGVAHDLSCIYKKLPVFMCWSDYISVRQDKCG